MSAVHCALGHEKGVQEALHIQSLANTATCKLHEGMVLTENNARASILSDVAHIIPAAVHVFAAVLLYAHK